MVEKSIYKHSQLVLSLSPTSEELGNCCLRSCIKSEEWEGGQVVFPECFYTA